MLAASRRAEAGEAAHDHPRPSRRQRRRGAHASAVVRAASIWPAALRSAADRGYAHGLARGGGGEPAPAPGRLPALRAWPAAATSGFMSGCFPTLLAGARGVCSVTSAEALPTAAGRLPLE